MSTPIAFLLIALGMAVSWTPVLGSLVVAGVVYLLHGADVPMISLSLAPLLFFMAMSFCYRDRLNALSRYKALRGAHS
nr:hypothetical protein [Enterovibrio norvegicus]